MTADRLEFMQDVLKKLRQEAGVAPTIPETQDQAETLVKRLRDQARWYAPNLGNSANKHMELLLTEAADELERLEALLLAAAPELVAALLETLGLLESADIQWGQQDKIRALLSRIGAAE